MTRTTSIERFRPSLLSYLAIACLAGTVVSTAEAQQESRREPALHGAETTMVAQSADTSGQTLNLRGALRQARVPRRATPPRPSPDAASR